MESLYSFSPLKCEWQAHVSMGKGNSQMALQYINLIRAFRIASLSTHPPEDEHDKVRYRTHFASSFAYLRYNVCIFGPSTQKLTSTFTENPIYPSQFYLNM